MELVRNYNSSIKSSTGRVEEKCYVDLNDFQQQKNIATSYKNMATTNPKVESGIKACRRKWGNMRWWVIWASVISFYRSIQYKICRSEKKA